MQPMQSQSQTPPPSLHPNPTTPLAPHPSRPYLTFSRRSHPSSNNLNSSFVSSQMHQEHSNSLSISQTNAVIYGTTINTAEVIRNIQKFLMEFQIMVEIPSETGPKTMFPKRIYFEELKSLLFDQERTLFTINASHLIEYDVEMYYELIYFPAEMISCFDITLKKVFEDLYLKANETGEDIDTQRYQKRKQRLIIQIQSLNQTCTMRNLTHQSINKLISFKGIVIRCSSIQPQMKSAYFRCCECKHFTTVQLQTARVSQPKECQRCKSKSTMQIVHNKCLFTDKQFIKVQQLPEYVSEGETPQSINLVAYDEFVDKLKPGDRADIVGVYRTQPLRVSKSKRLTKSVFNVYVDLISSKIIMDNKFKVHDRVAQEFTDQQIKEFFEVAKDPDCINKLVKSFCPSIFGCEDIKKGILALLFSGSQKKSQYSSNGRFRSDINICLVGDPSTAKSQLLQQVHKISPRGIYTSGRGSSAVGLTANVKKDHDTRQFILESGALVMSDMGICCIDEFDKMDDNNKTILLEVMEQQTISVAKAGIVCSLKSRTSILAAANPVNSRYNPKKSVVENINLPPNLLSRFDLIYIMLDRAVESYDVKLAHHILSIYSDNNPEQQIHQGYFSKEFFTNYITYAKLYINPKLSKLAAIRLADAYVKMRSIGISRKVISATPRQLESLIRLSQALAKMRMSQIVEELDVEQAIALMRVATQQSATDPTTGCIDMDVLVTGRTAAFRTKINVIAEKLREHINSNVGKYRKGVNYEFVMEQARLVLGEMEGISIDLELKQALKLLVTEEVIITYGANKNKPSVKLCKDMYVDQ